MIQGYEPYLISSWLDRGMSVQVAKPVEKLNKENKRTAAQDLVSKFVRATVFTAGISLTSFSWAGGTSVAVTNGVIPETAVSAATVTSDFYPSGFIQQLAERLRNAPVIADEVNFADPDPLF